MILPSAYDRAAVDPVAAGDADRVGVDVRAVLPLEREVRLGEIEGVEHVRPRRHHVHRVVHDERLPLVSAEDAGGEVPDRAQAARVRRRDLGEIGESRGGVVVRRHRPLARVLGEGGGGERDEECGEGAEGHRRVRADGSDALSKLLLTAGREVRWHPDLGHGAAVRLAAQVELGPERSWPYRGAAGAGAANRTFGGGRHDDPPGVDDELGRHAVEFAARHGEWIRRPRHEVCRRADRDVPRDSRALRLESRRDRPIRSQPRRAVRQRLRERVLPLERRDEAGQRRARQREVVGPLGQHRAHRREPRPVVDARLVRRADARAAEGRVVRRHRVEVGLDREEHAESRGARQILFAAYEKCSIRSRRGSSPGRSRRIVS